MVGVIVFAVRGDGHRGVKEVVPTLRRVSGHSEERSGWMKETMALRRARTGGGWLPEVVCLVMNLAG